jgi:hypothetical protein
MWLHSRRLGMETLGEPTGPSRNDAMDIRLVLALGRRCVPVTNPLPIK